MKKLKEYTREEIICYNGLLLGILLGIVIIITWIKLGFIIVEPIC